MDRILAALVRCESLTDEALELVENGRHPLELVLNNLRMAQQELRARIMDVDWRQIKEDLEDG